MTSFLRTLTDVLESKEPKPVSNVRVKKLGRESSKGPTGRKEKRSSLLFGGKGVRFSFSFLLFTVFLLLLLPTSSSFYSSSSSILTVSRYTRAGFPVLARGDSRWPIHHTTSRGDEEDDATSVPFADDYQRHSLKVCNS
jgi:hypothetical protein